MATYRIHIKAFDSSGFSAEAVRYYATPPTRNNIVAAGGQIKDLPALHFRALSSSGASADSLLHVVEDSGPGTKTVAVAAGGQITLPISVNTSTVAASGQIALGGVVHFRALDKTGSSADSPFHIYEIAKKTTSVAAGGTVVVRPTASVAAGGQIIQGGSLTLRFEAAYAGDTGYATLAVNVPGGGVKLASVAAGGSIAQPHASVSAGGVIMAVMQASVAAGGTVAAGSMLGATIGTGSAASVKAGGKASAKLAAAQATGSTAALGMSSTTRVPLNAVQATGSARAVSAAGRGVGKLAAVQATGTTVALKSAAAVKVALVAVSATGTSAFVAVKAGFKSGLNPVMGLGATAAISPRGNARVGITPALGAGAASVIRSAASVVIPISAVQGVGSAVAVNCRSGQVVGIHPVDGVASVGAAKALGKASASLAAVTGTGTTASLFTRPVIAVGLPPAIGIGNLGGLGTSAAVRIGLNPVSGSFTVFRVGTSIGSSSAIISGGSTPETVYRTLTPGIFQGDIIIRSAVIMALKEIRDNPDLIDDCLASLPQDDLTSGRYGDKTIEQCKEWFTSTNIPVKLGLALTQLTSPCISIEMDSGEEGEATLADRNYIVSESDPSDPTGVRRLESVHARESYSVTVMAQGEPELMLFLYSLVLFGLLRRKSDLLDCRGFTRMTWNVGVAGALENMPGRENFFVRSIKLNGYVLHGWPGYVAPSDNYGIIAEVQAGLRLSTSAPDSTPQTPTMPGPTGADPFNPADWANRDILSGGL